MAAQIVVCSILKILFISLVLLFSYLNLSVSQEALYGDDLISAVNLLKTASDILKDTYRRIDKLEFIKQDNVNSVQYEVGYVTYTLNEKYRKMIDKYNTSKTMGGKLFQMELIMYLEEIELHFWEIDHLANMLHEVERKYKINTSLYSTFHEITSEEMNVIRKEKAKAIAATSVNYGDLYYKPKTKRFVLSDYIKNKLNPPPPTTKKNNWPIEYGWDAPVYVASKSSNLIKISNTSIFNELSWDAKLLLLKHFDPYQASQPNQVAPNPPTAPDSVVHKPAEGAKNRRIPELESPVEQETQNESEVQNKVQSNQRAEDEVNMRNKLFKLMYEIVRDTDLKFKRADLMKTHYANNPEFEIGYLMSEVMGKYSAMNDMSETIERLFFDWKPMEHINAYEQISTQAIEINQLINAMKILSQKENDSPIPQL